MRKSVRRLADRYSLRSTLAFAAVAGGAAVFFIWKLGSLTPGLGPAEHAARVASRDFSSIISNPINFPQKIFEFIFIQAGFNSHFWLRLPSVILGLFFLFCFYLVLRRWFGKLIAVSGTALFASLPWIILLARHATPEIMFLAPMMVLAACLWLFARDEKPLALILFAIACSVSLYVPGALWFIFVTFLIWRRDIIESAQDAGLKWSVIAVITGIVLLAPLVLAAASDMAVAKELLLIPASWGEPLSALKSVGSYALALGWRTPEAHPMVLASLPLLGITHLTLALFGGYATWKRARSQLFVLVTLLLLGIIGAGLNDKLSLLSLALPALGALGAAGLRYLFGEWRSVFPVNPFPKALATGLIATLILVNLMVGFRYALLAWPQSGPTEETFVLQ